MERDPAHSGRTLTMACSAAKCPTMTDAWTRSVSEDSTGVLPPPESMMPARHGDESQDKGDVIVTLERTSSMRLLIASTRSSSPIFAVRVDATNRIVPRLITSNRHFCHIISRHYIGSSVVNITSDHSTSHHSQHILVNITSSVDITSDHRRQHQIIMPHHIIRNTSSSTSHHHATPHHS
jgi:hypothetical protein